MCVVICCDQGAYPDHATIQSCELTNPDGNGFAVVRDGDVYYEKGVDLRRLIEITEQAEDEGWPLILHFRLATVGDTTDELCHPFPCDEPNKASTTLEGTAEQVLFHNGSVRDWKRFLQASVEAAGQVSSNHTDWSDTRGVALLTARYGPVFLEAFSKSNRFVLLDSDGTFEYFGNWDNYQGMKFSNMSWRVTSGARAYGTYGWGHGRPASTGNSYDDSLWVCLTDPSGELVDQLDRYSLRLEYAYDGSLRLVYDDDQHRTVADFGRHVLDIEARLLKWSLLDEEEASYSEAQMKQANELQPYIIQACRVAGWELSVKGLSSSTSRYKLVIPNGKGNYKRKWYSTAEDVTKGVTDRYVNWMQNQMNEGEDDVLTWHFYSLLTGEENEAARLEDFDQANSYLYV